MKNIKGSNYSFAVLGKEQTASKKDNVVETINNTDCKISEYYFQKNVKLNIA